MAKSEEEFTSPADMFLSGNSQQEDTQQNETAQQENTQAAQQPDADNSQPKIPAGYRLVRETKSARMQLLVTPRLKEEIETAAKNEGISANNLVNLILMEHFEGGK